LVLTAIAGSLTGRLWTDNAQKISYCLSVITLIMYGLVIYNIFFIYIDLRNGQLDLHKFKTITIIVLSVINVVSFIIVVAMHICTHPKFVFKLLLDQISYIMYTGAYSQTMVIHGFCNIDDVSWGTKGATDTHGGKARFFESKVKFISSW
jgi:chitin synthase